MLQTWFKIFFRNSKKNWLNIFINVLGLTLGLAVLLIVLLYFTDEKSYNTSNKEKDTVYRVIHNVANDDDYWHWCTDIEGKVYAEMLPEIESFYMSKGKYKKTVIKNGNKEVYTTNIVLGEPNFFNFFPFEVVNGSLTEFKKARNNIAFSKERAQLIFGDENPIGKTVELYGRVLMVTAVYKITGKNYYMPNAVIQFKKEPNGNWGYFSKTLFVKSNQNITSKEFDKKVNQLIFDVAVGTQAKASKMTKEEYVERYGVIKTVFEPLSTIRLETLSTYAGPEGKGNYQMILILLSLAILLLIISSVNVVNLSIASATQRAKEVGVKKTLGFSKSNIALEYCLEIIFQGILAFLLAIILVELILPFFNAFMQRDISIFNFQVLLKVGLITLLLSILIGSIPSLYLANFKAVSVLKGNISRGKQGVVARKLMLGLQFLISGFFLIGSLLINKQIGYMIDKDLGFSGDQVVLFHFYDGKNKQKKYQLAKRELIKYPNIKEVTASSIVIGGDNDDATGIEYEKEAISVYVNAIDYNYFDFMDIDVIKGRALNPTIASDTIRNVIINEAFAKRLNFYDNPINKIINTGSTPDNKDGKAKIVGMINDYHFKGLEAKIKPTIYFHWNTFKWKKNNVSYVQLKINPNNMQETFDYIEGFWKENIESGYPFNPIFLNEQFAETYKSYQKQKILFLILTIVVILISLLGLFALATLTIQQRLKEVAIRKALGASVKEIMIPLMKSFVVITIIASVILIPLAYYFGQNWLNNFAYRIDMPIIPYIITPIILTLLVFIVVGVKAYNATKVDLIKYLKFE